MQIRPLEITDSLQLWQLINHNRQHLQTYFPKTLALITDIQTTEAYIIKKVEEAAAKKTFFFLVSVSGMVAGAVIIKEIDWSVPKCEIAYFVGKENERKGIGSEAVKWLVNFCFTELKIEKIYAKINPANTGSRMVVIKNGFIKEGYLRKEYRNGKGELTDSEYYGLCRE